MCACLCASSCVFASLPSCLHDGSTSRCSSSNPKQLVKSQEIDWIVRSDGEASEKKENSHGARQRSELIAAAS